jgi:hypothetical protein
LVFGKWCHRRRRIVARRDGEALVTVGLTRAKGASDVVVAVAL